MKRQLLVSILVLVLSLPSFAVTIDVWLQHTNEEMKILREITDKFTEKPVLRLTIPTSTLQTAKRCSSWQLQAAPPMT